MADHSECPRLFACSLLVVGCANGRRPDRRSGGPAAGTRKAARIPRVIAGGRSGAWRSSSLRLMRPGRLPGRAFRQTTGWNAGAYTGFLTGLIFVQSFPLFLLTWPVAAGILAGARHGRLGVAGGWKFEEFEAATIGAAGGRANLRSIGCCASVRPSGWPRAPAGPRCLCSGIHPGPDTPGTDPFADARARVPTGAGHRDRGLRLGAATNRRSTGSFSGRARVFDPTGETLRYERIVSMDGATLAGFPPPAAYTLEFLGWIRHACSGRKCKTRPCGWPDCGRGPAFPESR